jgi:NAD(P)-dependent dehydrogenase (short-subunit alcohol dehydrogenase family)
MNTVIITGATGNLGLATTQVFLAKGYRVLATVTNDEAKKSLPAHEHLETETLDLTSEDAAASMVHNTIKKYGKIDAALLLVGGFAMGDIKATRLEHIKKQISLNFDTAYNIAKPVFEQMISQGSGRLVFVGSRPALKSADGKNMIAYSLSKSLLFKLAEFLNEEAKGKNVTATVIVPSTIDTPINRSSMPDVNPDKWVKPEAIAEILEFVCSDKASSLRETVLKVYNNA